MLACLLTYLPTYLLTCFLQILRILHLDSNQLTALPEELTQLVDLEQLHVQNNQLTGLPLGISNLVYLYFLNLNGNPLTGATRRCLPPARPILMF